MTNEELIAALDKKVVTDDTGTGVEITAIDAVESDKGITLELMGMATHALKFERRPEAGFDPLPEPYPVSERIDLSAADRQKTFDKLNRAFKLPVPLMDREGEEERFLEGTEKSVYPHIVGKRVFFKLTLQEKTAAADWKYGLNFFSNIVAPFGVRQKPSKELFAKLKKPKIDPSAFDYGNSVGDGLATVGAGDDIFK